MVNPQEVTNLNIKVSYEKPRNLPTVYMNWLKRILDEILTEKTSEFFGTDFRVFLVALTESPLPFWKENDYFVTQIAITNNCSVQQRISNTVSGIFLDESLGARPNTQGYFKFRDITRFEAEVLTGYSEFLYKGLTNVFIEKRKIQKIKDPGSLLHMTLLVNTQTRLEQNLPCGKIVVTFPASILQQPEIPQSDLPVDLSKYYNARSETNIFIGRATITLDDLKKIGINDVIILDHSNLNKMHVFNEQYSLPFKVSPDQSIVLNIHSEEYKTMNEDVLQKVDAGSAIWDSLQVDVAAEFKQIKIPLGELRT